MVISDVSIKRPVFATVISLLIVVFGLSGLLKLPVREYPDIDPPEVSVSVEYRGAAPEVIDTQIVQIVEAAISGVEGVERIESRSRIGSARTSIILTVTWMRRPTMFVMPSPEFSGACQKMRNLQ